MPDETIPPILAPLVVPMRRYFPPNGQSQLGQLIIINAYTPERADKLKQIIDPVRGGMEFTIEVLSMGMVNICLDTGESDYRFEVVTPEQVNDKVLELIDTFDLNAFILYQAAQDQTDLSYLDPEAQHTPE